MHPSPFCHFLFDTFFFFGFIPPTFSLWNYIPKSILSILSENGRRQSKRGKNSIFQAKSENRFKSAPLNGQLSAGLLCLDSHVVLLHSAGSLSSIQVSLLPSANRSPDVFNLHAWGRRCRGKPLFHIHVTHSPGGPQTNLYCLVSIHLLMCRTDSS